MFAGHGIGTHKALDDGRPRSISYCEARAPLCRGSVVASGVASGVAECVASASGRKTQAGVASAVCEAISTAIANRFYSQASAVCEVVDQNILGVKGPGLSVFQNGSLIRERVRSLDFSGSTLQAQGLLSVLITTATGDEVDYATRVDFDGETIIYRGEAVPGSAESSAVWRIRRITLNAEGDATTEYAEGDAQFDNIWNDRASLSYS